MYDEHAGILPEMRGYFPQVQQELKWECRIDSNHHLYNKKHCQ